MQYYYLNYPVRCIFEYFIYLCKSIIIYKVLIMRNFLIFYIVIFCILCNKNILLLIKKLIVFSIVFYILL